MAMAMAENPSDLVPPALVCSLELRVREYRLANDV